MARKPRRQIVELGGFPAIKIGGPSPFGDIYYWVMEMSWPAFIGLTSLIFLAINLLFGTLYALLPGTVANAEPGSIVDGFFFSVDTLGTVGYGAMAPATRLGHGIASVEILTGLFFSATMTGLIFARFARPRQSLVFSRVAVVGRYAGKKALMVRVASMRSRPLANATAQMSYLHTVHLPGGRTFRSLTTLPLIRDINPLLALSWTLVHLMEDDSPLLEALAGSDRFLLTVTIGGLDTLLASPSQGGTRYDRDQVLIDHEFVDVISDEQGAIRLDMTLLHDAVPIQDLEPAA
ncbi:MAG: potassium channel protein [Sphingomonas bacterium]|uniref:ion channel n=1 Tax=Sphingomonas bacterium TaxID=1895847 RepID=UPI00261F8E37|nr:ion channel [Sphingomonas bacterium]MDB5704858.1 potassium channel protein [Sphingomonas bacterium]